MTTILTRSDLEELVDVAATIQAIERVMADLTRGTATTPPPAVMHLGDSPSRFLPMAAQSDGDELASVKLLADIPTNAERGLPTQRSSLVLVSSQTGETLALLDGRVPTRVRTAAASAVATRYLARSDSKVLGLVGAGALAVEHVAALLEILPFEQVVFWTRRRETEASFRGGVEHHGLDLCALPSARDVVEAADVICTLTPSETPIVSGKWFRPGQHINAVGARPRPDHREIDTAGMVRASVFVDSLAAVRQESGDVLIPVGEGALRFDDLKGELGAVITGEVPGRADPGDITLYKSLGLGVQDLAIGRLLYDRATKTGAGVHLDLGS